jgi:glycosyltransferase involved in cell wall biosynthesis
MQVEESDLSRSVDLVGYQKNPYAWMAKADLFVLSSDYEGFPMAILEAMACGAPVVATDVASGPGEIIRNGINGILVAPHDESALASSITAMLKDEARRRRISAQGRITAAAFDSQSIARQYIELMLRGR